MPRGLSATCSTPPALGQPTALASSVAGACFVNRRRLLRQSPALASSVAGACFVSRRRLPRQSPALASSVAGSCLLHPPARGQLPAVASSVTLHCEALDARSPAKHHPRTCARATRARGTHASSHRQAHHGALGTHSVEHCTFWMRAERSVPTNGRGRPHSPMIRMLDGGGEEQALGLPAGHGASTGWSC